MTILGYRRISLATETSGSLEKQKTQVEGWAVAQGHDPAQIVWFTDESISGSKDGIRRPGREALLEKVSQGDVVAITKIDRLARSVRDLLDIVEHVKSVGGSVVFVEDAIQTSGPYGNFMLILLGAIAQLEAEIIGERIRVSKADFRKRGRFATGKVPLGWRSVPREDGPGLVLELDPIDGPKVRQAILNILGGASQGSQAKELGISRTGMNRLLHSPRLAGMTPYGDGVVLADDGLPLVSERARLLSPREYEALQEYLDKPTKTYQRNPNGYAGALFCPDCEQRLYYSADKRSPYDRYKCATNKWHLEHGGKIASIRREPTDAFLEKWFLENHGNDPILEFSMPVTSTRDRDLERVKVGIQQATLALTEARDPQTRTEVMEHLTELLAQRDEIEAQPAGFEPRTMTIIEQTVGDVWKQASDQDRTYLLRAVGGWYVEPGRKGPEDRLRFDPDLASEEERPGLPIRNGPAWFLGEGVTRKGTPAHRLTADRRGVEPIPPSQ